MAPFTGPGGETEKVTNPPPKRRVKTIEDKEVRVTEIIYHMGELFDSCVDLHCVLAKANKDKLPIAATPFLEESGEHFGLGAEVELNEDTAHAALHECLRPGSASSKACSGKKIPPELRKEIFGKKKSTPETEPDVEPEPNGYMQPHAAKILMKILYGARMARFDLLRAISYLASSVTKWTKQCDEDLFRLICYMHTTRDYRQVAWVGDDLDDVKLRLYADADFQDAYEHKEAPQVHAYSWSARTPAFC